jgi:SAM-dependent methyltransferase
MLIGAAAATAVVFVVRHVRGRRVRGGILVGDVDAYDALSHRVLLRSFYAGIAEDVAAVAPKGTRVLEVGCGPGRLSILLAGRYGLDVTGVDLDPAMVDRARANADRSGDGRGPSFLVGDVASLAFADASFDLVVSTLSVHHWGDPTAGLTEIGRVLRPVGRALIWDLRPGLLRFHRHVPDPFEHTHGSPLRVVREAPWRWPWRFHLTRRIELARADSLSEHSA